MSPEIVSAPLSESDKAQIRGSGNTAIKILAAVAVFVGIVSAVFFYVGLAFVGKIIAGAAGLVVVVAILIKVLTGAAGSAQKQILRGRLDDKYFCYRNDKDYWFSIDRENNKVITEKIYLGSHVKESWSKSYSTTPNLYFQFGPHSVPVNVGVFMDFEVGDVMEIHFIESQRRVFKAEKIAA